MDTRERVAGLLCDPKAVVYPCPMCFAKATAIMRLVDEERADLVKALRECKRLVDCGEWGDVPSVVYAALGERR